MSLDLLTMLKPGRKTAQLIFLFSSLFWVMPDASGQTRDASMRVTDLKAMVFFQETGTLSPDILPTPLGGLWNIGMGGGSAGAPSSSTFVLVEITGGTPAQDNDGQLEFIARYQTEDNRPARIVRRRVPFFFFGDKNKLYAGFMLYETGCFPIELRARIVGQRRALTMKRTINYACGE